jgi:phosphopentomutase
MAGIILDKPFPVYPHGFPREIMDPFERAIGRSALGNKAASGTEILRELGAEHITTGFPIVYTSADSVFQIAAHEEIISPSELYDMCRIARNLLRGRHEVGRVIARPFIGATPKFTRTARRKDFAIPPPNGMLLDLLSESQVQTFAVGKISDIFLGRGIKRSIKTENNEDGMNKILALMEQQQSGLLWANLVDFDQLYGHRNDVEGYAAALERVDSWIRCLPIEDDDLVLLSADHGCDPTTPSTDHSREYTPLLAYGKRVKTGVALGTRATLADIGQTVAKNFGVQIMAGISFLEQII